MAIGGITQGSVYMLGEGASSTFAGRGAEAVIPLNSRGIGILAEAVRQGTGGAPEVKVLVRPDRRRFNRDLSWDYQTRGL